MQKLSNILFGALFCASTLTHAAIVDIKFDAEGRFSHEAEMAVGKTLELCGALKANVPVDWSFSNAAPLNFNIHFHKGDDVVYPVQQKGAVNLAQKFTPDAAQDYCWMWTNRNLQPVKLNVKLALPTMVATVVAAAPATTPKTAAASAEEMVAGEIRKIERDTKKITIKHAEIKSLDMPAMTMVFQLNDPALMDKVQVGDNVKFKVEKIGRAYVVTDVVTQK